MSCRTRFAAKSRLSTFDFVFLLSLLALRHANENPGPAVINSPLLIFQMTPSVPITYLEDPPPVYLFPNLPCSLYPMPRFEMFLELLLDM